VIRNLGPAASDVMAEAEDRQSAGRSGAKQLKLLDVLQPEVVRPTQDAQSAWGEGRADRRSTQGSHRRSRDGERGLRRLAVKPDEAAEMLGISRDYFDEHIKPELRIVRRGSKTILIAVAELERWLDESATRFSC
jgi:hypothetical protein